MKYEIVKMAYGYRTFLREGYQTLKTHTISYLGQNIFLKLVHSNLWLNYADTSTPAGAEIRSFASSCNVRKLKSKFVPPNDNR